MSESKPGPKGPRKLMRADGYRGGNDWTGPNRKGYRGGRVPVYPLGTTTWPTAVSLSDQDYATALMLGCGNAGRGLRIALKSAAGKLNPVIPIPSTRVEAENLIRPARKRIAQLVSKALGFQVRAPKPAGNQAKPPDVTPIEEWDDV